MQNGIKFEKGESIIPIECLKAVELGPNDTLIIEVPARMEISGETKKRIEDSISEKTGSRTLLLTCGLTAKAVLKSAKL